MTETTDVQKWADAAMFHAQPMASTTPQVHLLWMTPDPLGAIAAACRIYEGIPTYSLSDIDNDERRHYLEQVQKTHLKAPLEFVKMHFFIEGVTRSHTHQMVRQRTAVYAQESLRFAVKDDLAAECQLPPSIAEMAEDAPARVVWAKTLEQVEQAYHGLIAAGVPAEDARGVMPHAVTTRLNYCTDLRALLDHAGNRLCTQAQFEWRMMMTGIVKAIREYDPEFGGAVAGLFRPVCYELGHCPFTAVFDRACAIRGRVEANSQNGIKSKDWDPRSTLWDGYKVPDNAPRSERNGLEFSGPIATGEWLGDHTAARIKT